MRIVVFGAGGRVGSRTVAEALARGHEVTAVVRDPEAHDLHGDGLTVVAGDATDPASVAEAAAGHDLAISTVGTGFGKAPETLPAAARALLEGLSRAGVGRLIVLAAPAASRWHPACASSTHPTSARSGKPDALAQAEALDLYRSATTDVDWTYVSPAAVLEPGERTGEYRTGDDRLLVDDEGNSAISMEDFAVALLDEAESADHVRRRFTVASYGWFRGGVVDHHPSSQAAGADVVPAPVRVEDRVRHDAVVGGRDRRRGTDGDADVRRAGAEAVEEDEVAAADVRARRRPSPWRTARSSNAARRCRRAPAPTSSGPSSRTRRGRRRPRRTGRRPSTAPPSTASALGGAGATANSPAVASLGVAIAEPGHAAASTNAAIMAALVAFIVFLAVAVSCAYEVSWRARADALRHGGGDSPQGR